MTNIILKETKENERGLFLKYEVGNYLVTKAERKDGDVFFDIKKVNRGRFIPDVYVNVDYKTEEILGFDVQTTSYGTLGINELTEMIEGLQEAREVVVALEKEFLNK